MTSARFHTDRRATTAFPQPTEPVPSMAEWQARPRARWWPFTRAEEK